jgi:hypothetical protein
VISQRPFPCALAGFREGPFEHAWRRSLVSVGVDPSCVEKQLLSGELACPDCGGRLAPWGHVPERFVREDGGSVRRMRLRRAICSREGGCRRTHVLLPRLCLGRRVDPVAVIWPALLNRAEGWGWRRICAAAGRPASTVRGWLSRFAAHAEPIRAGFALLERHAGVGADMDRLAPAGVLVADALDLRGFGARHRTWVRTLRFGGIDLVVVGLAVLVATAASAATLSGHMPGLWTPGCTGKAMW